MPRRSSPPGSRSRSAITGASRTRRALIRSTPLAPMTPESGGGGTRAILDLQRDCQRRLPHRKVVIAREHQVQRLAVRAHPLRREAAPEVAALAGVVAVPGAIAATGVREDRAPLTDFVQSLGRLGAVLPPCQGLREQPD